MEVYKGKGVFPGVAFGMAFLLERREVTVRDPAGEPEEELARYLAALDEADRQLEALYEKTKREVGEDEADIIDVQRLMLRDGDFDDSVREKIQGGTEAAQAVTETGEEIGAFFAGLDDKYMKARATDVADISRRLADILLGRGVQTQLTRPSIIVADDLTPSETLQMDKAFIRGFVMRRGSSSSHTAILARSMGIPCLIKTDIPANPSMSGADMALDGESGICYLMPDEPTRRALIAKQEEAAARKRRMENQRGLPTVTKDGRTVRLFSNIGGIGDVSAVLENDSEGIGLLRSEFLYLGRNDYPSEDELFKAYRDVAEGMGDRLVIIRTMDIGADKKVDYFGLEEEENPALGLRGVRISIERPELLKTQLRAIYRASAYGNVAVMFPMIISIWEVRRCRELAEEALAELRVGQVPVGNVELGVMIETPAAALIADSLAREVDFFSVGTNDLTQYTLAIDRQNNCLERFHDPHHPSVLRLLRMVAAAAIRGGIWAGVCGELASDLSMTETLVNMGYSELSVSPVYTLALRERIREIENS